MPTKKKHMDEKEERKRERECDSKKGELLKD